MKAFTVILLTLMSVQSWATADSLQKVAIPHFSNLQDTPDFDYNTFNSQPNSIKKFCLTRALFWDGISTSSVTRIDTVTSDFPVHAVGLIPQTMNVNLVSRPDINFIYTYNSIDNYVQSGGSYVHEPALTIDVSAMARSTASERLQTLTYAKLALLAVTRTLRFPYKATINVSGLPNQTGISRPSFTAVNASTTWPYTDSSSLLTNYENELLDSNCQ